MFWTSVYFLVLLNYKLHKSIEREENEKYYFNGHFITIFKH